ncbi:MAG: urea ABC transporter permease subunit UrtB [Nibricoccus sp.]
MLCLVRQFWKYALLLLVATITEAAETPRQIIANATLAKEDAKKRELILSLMGQSDDAIEPLLTAWRRDALFLYTAADSTLIPVQLVGEKDPAGTQVAERIVDGKPLLGAEGKPMRVIASELAAVEHTSSLRRAMKAVLDVIDVGASDPARRIKAIQAIGQAQDASKLPALEARAKIESQPKVQRVLREAIALTKLKDPKSETKLAALVDLRELHTLSSSDFLNRALKEAETAKNGELQRAARSAIHAVEQHRSAVDFVGTLFRGVSAGSILLVLAVGLAISFGLMGVINMAHGEMVAVGAYTTYLVQNFFGDGVTIPAFGLSISIPGLHLSGAAYNIYFIAALPLSFLAAAFVGVILERSIIQFLYRRPLESLLATWGVSLVLQQIFRLMFGANNVNVSSPAFLSGNWTVNDIIFGWNRMFVIGFGVLIVVGIWLVLKKTPLGLLMRAVTQNRTMASCMGVRTDRVNMMTFALGSGLAGLAGAFISQIDNVGPALGQTYIVDSFMVVVLGGVGSLAGTVISAVGIGSVDNFFQQYVPAWAPSLSGVPFIGNFLQNLGQDSAVFGKIFVLAGIILFLQWRPAGLFVTRNRSLEG